MSLMDRLYDNLDEAKAFEISFTNFVHCYDDTCYMDFAECVCEVCDRTIQTKDFLVPKANCKKPYGILSSLDMGVNQELRDELIERFDVTENDFRPVRNKRGEIVFYQITPQHVMLPIAKENGWNQLPACPKCGAVRYASHEYENEKGEFYYNISQEALRDIHDFNITCELLECYRPMYVISRRVYDFLIKKYPRTHYFPLFLKH